MSAENLHIAEEHGECAPQSKSFSIKWILIATAIGIGIYLLPTPEGMSLRAHKYLALLLPVVLLWTVEAMPIGVTAIGVGALLGLFEIQTVANAWAPYANRSVVFVFMIIMMGVVISQTSLPQRILNGVIKVGGRGTTKLSFTLCMAATLLSMWTHDAAITIILLYSLVPLFNRMGITPATSNNLSKHFLLVVPLGAACGGGGTFVGSGRSPAAAEMFFAATGYQIGFTEYAIYCILPSIVYGIGTWIALMIALPPKVKYLPDEAIAAKLPSMTKNEKYIGMLLLFTIAMYCISDYTKVHVSIIGALFIVVCMALQLVDWKKCVLEFPWNPMMVFGAGFALGIAMLDTGAGKWLAEQAFVLVEGYSWPIVSFGVGWISAILTSFMANAAATALLVPVVVPMADLAGVPTFPIAMTVPLATTFVLLIIGCPPTLIAYGLGYFTQIEAFKVLVVRTVICLFLASIMQSLWWPVANMPGNIDMMQTPAKLTPFGYELIKKP
jgi:sodium-dependent dicarboxylate transporter 2/3/5